MQVYTYKNWKLIYQKLNIIGGEGELCIMVLSILILHVKKALNKWIMALTHLINESAINESFKILIVIYIIYRLSHFYLLRFVDCPEN